MTEKATGSAGMTESYPPIDPSTIAPLNDKGAPDLYNNLPSRIIALAEAKARGWPTFFDTSTCRYGHQAPHYVSNPRLCVDCHRVKAGKAPIGAKAAAAAEYKRPYKQREQMPAGSVVAVAAAPLEPDAREKKFLEAYAAYRDMGVAAKAAGETAAKIASRMAYSTVFRDAVNRLEDQLGIKRTQLVPLAYEWSQEKRDRFIQAYIDSGDQATARDAIGLTPSQYYEEIERNPEFADAVRGAEPLAMKSLEEKAIQLALAGNDKLLTKILSAKMPEYRERIDLNVRNKDQLSDKQLDNRLVKLLGKYRERIAGVIDAEYSVVEPQRQIAAPANAGGDREGREPDDNSDLL